MTANAHPAREPDVQPVAQRLGLSLRTLRYWEEMGLVTPTSRDRGGSRFYSEADIARLEIVRAMKPMDLSIDELRDLLLVYGRLSAGGADSTTLTEAESYAARIRARCEVLESRVIEARAAAEHADEERLGRARRSR